MGLSGIVKGDTQGPRFRVNPNHWYPAFYYLTLCQFDRTSGQSMTPLRDTLSILALSIPQREHSASHIQNKHGKQRAPLIPWPSSLAAPYQDPDRAALLSWTWGQTNPSAPSSGVEGSPPHRRHLWPGGHLCRGSSPRGLHCNLSDFHAPWIAPKRYWLFPGFLLQDFKSPSPSSTDSVGTHQVGNSRHLNRNKVSWSWGLALG